MKHIIKKLVRSIGFDVKRYHSDLDISLDDITTADREILARVRPYTMTSAARILAIIDATRYISRNNIKGDIAECGVWRGGSMMAVALTLLDEGDIERHLYLYDTFQGMSAPTEADKDNRGISAESQLRSHSHRTGVWCYASLDDVKQNLTSTSYSTKNIHYIEGKVEDTIPANIPDSLAILRLDTDWYESTKHEFVYLYPLLVCNGILVIDDYGHWQGARKATDEYFKEKGVFPLLHRIDYTGRLFVKGNIPA